MDLMRVQGINSFFRERKEGMSVCLLKEEEVVQSKYVCVPEQSEGLDEAGVEVGDDRIFFVVVVLFGDALLFVGFGKGGLDEERGEEGRG